MDNQHSRITWHRDHNAYERAMIKRIRVKAEEVTQLVSDLRILVSAIEESLAPPGKASSVTSQEIVETPVNQGYAGPTYRGAP